MENTPGVEPVTALSIWDLIKRTASSWSDINAPRLGAALAFYTMFAAAPAWPYSRGWGYYPSGGLGLVVLILVILLLMGRI